MRKPKLKEKQYDLRIPIFDQYLDVVITNSVIKSRKNRTKILGRLLKGDDEDNTDVDGMFSNHKGRFFLFMRDDLSEDVLVHEIVHISHGMMKRVGMRYSRSSEEVYAYFSGWLFKNIKAIIRQHKLDTEPKTV